MDQVVILSLIGTALAANFMLAWNEHCKREALEKRVARLEEAGRKRIPYGAADELLDAMAALDRLTMDVDVLSAIKENVRAHIINALQIGTKNKK